MLLFKSMNGPHFERERVTATRLNKTNSSASASKLKEKDRFAQAFNVLVNYWEIKPSLYESKLQELALRDVRVVSSFLPWTHVETDIYHSLKKFLKAAVAVKLQVRLFVMPELGVNYPNAGVPKELLTNHSNLAVNRLGQVIYNFAAPNIFSLPSFASTEVLKRFGNYLIKVGVILGEVFEEVGGSSFCEVVVSNSLFNYYRSFGMNNADHGDYSAAHVMAFRDFLDREYKSATSSSEAVQRDEEFKMQLYEGYNRHRFFTHIEKLLREKTDMVFSRKHSNCTIRHVDLFNPEAAPELSYQGLLTEVFDFHPSVSRLYGAIVQGGYRGETVFLSRGGVLRKLTDQERSFLILASFIHSGEVGVEAEDLFKLSPNFQRKLRGMVNAIEEQGYELQRPVTYVSASKFSMEDRSFDVLSRLAPDLVTAKTDLSNKNRALYEKLVVLDPRSIVRLVELVQTLAIAQAGKVVAIPCPLPAAMKGVANYSMDAIAQYEKLRKSSEQPEGKPPLKLNMGVPYEVHSYGLGQVVFYDPTIFWSLGNANTEGNPREAISAFLKSLLGLTEVRVLCSATNLSTVQYVASEDSTKRLVFLVNPTSQDVDTNLTFTHDVEVGPLPTGALGETPRPIRGRTFELKVPALGVLPMQVFEGGGLGLDA